MDNPPSAVADDAACSACKQPIYKLPDGTWTLVYVEHGGDLTDCSLMTQTSMDWDGIYRPHRP